MTESVTFIEHADFGTCAELKGNVHMFSGKLSISIEDLKDILRLYNREYLGTKRKIKEADLTKKIYDPKRKAPVASPSCSVGGG